MEDEDYKLPCDVRLPPATVIRAGCSIKLLKFAMEQRDRPRHFAAGDPAENAPSCLDCGHRKANHCIRAVRRHFDAKTNSYRSRMDVLCTSERASDRNLVKRLKCGPSGRYFEPSGLSLPIGGKQGTVTIDEAAKFARVRDTVADSDGDDGS